MKDKLYKMMNWPEIEAIVYGEEGKPQTILGRHSVSTYTLFQTFQPNVKEVRLVIEEDKEHDKNKEYIMEMADEEGFYAIAILGKIKGSYHYVITDIKGKKHVIADPYDHVMECDGVSFDKFAGGSARDAYKFMGAHVMTINGNSGVGFRVWAPNAMRVSVVGDFNDWNGKSHPMMKDEEKGIFSLFIPGLSAGCTYKYELSVKGGVEYTKRDPFALEIKDGVCIVSDETEYTWSDAGYFKSVDRMDMIKKPLNIYQTELAKLADDKGLSAELMDKLVSHLKDGGYDYVQLIMDMTYKFALPAGIAVKDLKLLVDKLHGSKIGVICEWNPASFAGDAEGLGCFDGTYLYGHLDERKRYNLEIGGNNFNYTRQEVVSFLYSNASYWMKEFHMDGLHVNGLSSMLYLDYGKNDGEWVANIYGSNENLEAIDCIIKLNTVIHRDYPYAITTTREVGAFPKVTDKISDGGLGFDFIWNNGFTEDYLSFMKDGQPFTAINKLTDNMAYAYCENYILTISKEDVIEANDNDVERVEKGAGFFDYIPVPDEKKDAVKRATLAYYMAHPGKKLIYSGQDMDVESAALGKLYRDLSALYSLDHNQFGFEWINAINSGDGVVSFIRKDEYLEHSIFVVCNFSEKEYKTYKFGMPYEGKYKMIFNSDDKKYGGKSAVSNRFKETEDEFYSGRPNSLTVKIPPMSVSMYSYTPYNEEELLKIAEEKVRRYKEKVESEAKSRAKALRDKAVKSEK